MSEPSLTFYQSARTELIQRIVLRDGALIFYIGAVGTYLKVVADVHFESAPNFTKELVMMAPLPVVCLIFTLVVLQHHVVIGGLSRYLQEIYPEGYKPPHWDISATYKRVAPYAFLGRLLAQAGVLCLPLLFEIVFFVQTLDVARAAGPLWEGASRILVAVSLLTAVFIFYLHGRAHAVRKGLGPK